LHCAFEISLAIEPGYPFKELVVFKHDRPAWAHRKGTVIVTQGAARLRCQFLLFLGHRTPFTEQALQWMNVASENLKGPKPEAEELPNFSHSVGCAGALLFV
jgi:hypothetical protein